MSSSKWNKKHSSLFSAESAGGKSSKGKVPRPAAWATAVSGWGGTPAGAKEVHVRVNCPPHQHPCVYGIAFPDRNKLMAANYSVDEIRQYLNADSLAYLSQAGLVPATGLGAE